jgi:hypothetical protein
MIGFRLKALSVQGKRFIDKLNMANGKVSKNIIEHEPFYLVEFLFVDKGLQKAVKPLDVPNFLKVYAKGLRLPVMLGADYELIILDDDNN